MDMIKTLETNVVRNIVLFEIKRDLLYWLVGFYCSNKIYGLGVEVLPTITFSP